MAYQVQSGIFVVGDSKVAHFDMGDRVTLRVRGVRTNFGYDMIYVHDVVDVNREARPIKYAWANEGITSEDAGEVRRVRGEMITEPDTFGEFTVLTDEGVEVNVNLDAEINRRRQYPEVGSTLCATGPVQNSFGLSIVIMRLGQIAVVEGVDDGGGTILSGATALRTGTLNAGGEKISVGCLVRLEMNEAAAAFRLTVRTAVPHVSTALSDAIQNLL